MKKDCFEAFYQLTKPSIVKLVLLTGLAGYGLGFRIENKFSVLNLILFVVGLVAISAGSLALNQFQEHVEDSKMLRTQGRPIPSGKILPRHALIFSLVLCLFGLVALYFAQPLTALLGLITIFLYNFVYTFVFKKRIVFAAVPGAVPGAAPALLGYSVVNPHILNSEAAYVFLLMFLWQMPHFWALAIRYSDDYSQGGFPVLPSQLGDERTKLHMGLYMIPYLTLSIVSPFFVETHYFYYIFVIPITLVVAYEFYRFLKSNEKKSWIRFFIWINVSILIFLASPVIDKWGYYIAKIRIYE